MNIFKKWRNENYDLNYGNEQVVDFIKSIKQKDNKRFQILDIGCGNGRDLKQIYRYLRMKNIRTKCELFGIGHINIKGISIKNVDLENSSLPYKDNFFDITVCNQVYEHLKNWIWVLSEQLRVTKKNGYLIIGVPNLAALHCRIQLLLGIQPSCIKSDDAHVRGFTLYSLRKILQKIPGCKIINQKGANFYLFPRTISKYLAKLFPTLAVSCFFLIQKGNKKVNILKIHKRKKLETNYFYGKK
jgi:SAM-dependent methyltransferase